LIGRALDGGLATNQPTIEEGVRSPCLRPGSSFILVEDGFRDRPPFAPRVWKVPVVPDFSRQQLLIIFTLIVSIGVWLTPSAAEEFAAVRIVEAPEIDGKLTDECWKKAAQISDFKQRDPFEGQPPSEKTTVLICYDSENLYVAFRCDDSQPDGIRATVMQRDQSVGADDFVFILIDPYQRGRDGYYFRTNANGAVGEGLVSTDSRKPAMDWDAIWDAASHRDENGWTTEFAIPFRSLSFDGENGDWGINFGRWIPRLQERVKWIGHNQNHSTYGMEESGVIRGLEGLTRGVGVDFKPYVTSRYSKSNGVEDFEFDGGADVFYQFTPSLTATFTYNTDFAETEVDGRQINLTRFPLFFPEKRDFFLEGAEHFRFGGVSKSPLAFHSRTIGLANEEKVDVTGGAKLTGRQGPIGIGLLGLGLGSGADLQKDRVFAGRFTYDLLEESKAGLIYTHGDPQANLENQLVGFDLNLRDSTFRGGDELIDVHTFFMSTEDEVADQGSAFGISASYPNKPLWIDLEFEQIDENFEPAMGFVRRRDTRRFDARAYHFLYTESRDVIEQMWIGGKMVQYQRLDGRVETEEAGASFEIDMRNGSEITFNAKNQREVLFEPFQIVDEVTLGADDYSFTDFGLSYESSNNQPLLFELEGRFGEYFNGEAFRAEAEISWRPARYFQLDLGGQLTDARLPEGDFDAFVTFVNFKITPSRKWSWNTLFQYDNLSGEMGINSRFRYIVKPGNDVFVVFNKGFANQDGRLRSFSSEAIAKVGWTIRF
jgi:hypothetical protein